MGNKVKILIAKTYDGNAETDPSDTLAKQLFDLIESASTIESISICQFGVNILALVYYTTA